MCMPLFIYFLLSWQLAVGSNVAFLLLLFLFFFSFFWATLPLLSPFFFLGLGVGVPHFFFFWFSRADSCFFFFLKDLIFILGHDFYFFNKFGWLLFFCGYLSLFCFDWALFFNKDLWINLFKLIFFIFSLFHS